MCFQMGFEELDAMLCTRMRTPFSLISYSFIITNEVFNEFNRVLKRIDESDKERVLDKRIIQEEEFDPFIE